MTTDQLDWRAALAALRGLEGLPVAVRLVRPHDSEELIAIFRGTLGRLTTDAKQPSLFWPIGEPAAGHLEQPGVYLRERDFQRAEMRAGGVLVAEQAEVIINLRPLKERM